MPTELLQTHMECKHCKSMFLNETGGDICLECKIDRLFIHGQCPGCSQYLKLDVFEDICTHKLPGCYLLQGSEDIREFALKCIISMESHGLRVIYKSINGYPPSRVLSLKDTKLLEE